MPTDYLSGLGKLPDPMGDINNAINMRLAQQQAALQNQQMQMEMDAARAKEAKVAQFGTDAAGALTNPTAANISKLIISHPEYADQIKKGWDIKDDAVKQTDLTQLGEIYSAGSAGNFDLAAKAARRRLEADRAAGLADDGDEQLLTELESGDPKRQKAALGMIGVHLAAATGAEHFGSVYGALNKNGEAFTLDAGAIRYAGDGTVIAKSPYMKGADGEVYEADSPGGTPSASTAAPAGDASVPRSVRNNNPGNLRASPWTQKLPGYTGADSAGYAIFASPDAGNQAHATLLGGKGYYEGGRKSVASIIEKWAPRASKGGDNTDAQVDNYIGYVAKKLGVDPHDTLARPLLPKMAAAMSEFESGRTGGAGATRTAAAAPASNAPPGYHLLTPGKKEAAPTGFRWAANGALEAIPGGPADKPNGGSAKRMTPAEVAAEGLDPNVVYYRNADGVPTAVSGQDKRQNASLKPWPTPALESWSTKKAAASQMTPILRLLDPTNNSAEAKAARYAIGPSNAAVPNFVLQQTNPSGNKFRALIGKIGSIIIKDTSGAAVSISESDRLAKWVPLPTDTPAAARDKLNNLLGALQSETQAMEGTYTEDQGFRPPPGSGGAPVKVRSVQEAQKLPKGTLFVTPDGRTLRKR